mmetsp:Transcript_19637/g.57295  ORF Transcript_19637/g.57295 Transcript_19637/m.57295 type:complete len:242 (-) Transcript_19637:69-794(-)
MASASATMRTGSPPPPPPPPAHSEGLNQPLGDSRGGGGNATQRRTLDPKGKRSSSRSSPHEDALRTLSSSSPKEIEHGGSDKDGDGDIQGEANHEYPMVLLPTLHERLVEDDEERRYCTGHRGDRREGSKISRHMRHDDDGGDEEKKEHHSVRPPEDLLHRECDPGSRLQVLGEGALADGAIALLVLLFFAVDKLHSPRFQRGPEVLRPSLSRTCPNLRRVRGAAPHGWQHVTSRASTSTR